MFDNNSSHLDGPSLVDRVLGMDPPPPREVSSPLLALAVIALTVRSWLELLSRIEDMAFIYCPIV